MFLLKHLPSQVISSTFDIRHFYFSFTYRRFSFLFFRFSTSRQPVVVYAISSLVPRSLVGDTCTLGDYDRRYRGELPPLIISLNFYFEICYQRQLYIYYDVSSNWRGGGKYKHVVNLFVVIPFLSKTNLFFKKIPGS